jgi:hypothetical protein
MSSDHNVKRMMEELGRALLQAIGSSADVGQTVRQIHHEGYSLHLVLNCRQDRSREARLALTPRPDDGGPAFRLNSGDVSFLESLGIDPTRSARGRRSSSSRRR